MGNFYIQDDYNCRWKVGDFNNGLNKLPIYDTMVIRSWTVYVPSSLTSHGSTGLLTDTIPLYVSGNDYFKPISLVGWDLDAQSGIVIPSLFLSTPSSDGARTIKYKLHNAIDSTRNITSLTVYILHVLASVENGIYSY